MGTVQEPVSKDPPAKLAVAIFVFVYLDGRNARAPVIVVAAVLSVAEEDDDAVLLFAPPVVRLKGEHPTKLGAVEFTAAHSCMLNCMAACT